MVDPARIHTRAALHAALAGLHGDVGLSYHELAESSGVAPNTIHGWVHGQSLPRWSNLALVLRAWGVTDAVQVQRWRLAHSRARDQDAARPGVPLTELTDPFMVEVHRPITVDRVHDLPALPSYVRRAHDERLAAIVSDAVGGASAIAVLLADSSTGKTRALWEALTPLREQRGWRVWHPRYPTRQEELRERLRQVEPRTVVWLNETQRYFEGLPTQEQERTANALRGLLTDPRQAPVLILGSLWHEHYTSLCRDPGSATRALLGDPGVIIKVPAAFTGTDLDAMGRAAEHDPRLAQACERATAGQITQYLAGGPELINRYEFEVSAAARAVIEVAMDATRLGHHNLLPHALLHDAAAAYMSDEVWDGLTENWFELVLAETSAPCKGAPGPITPIRERPPSSRRRRGAHTPDQRGRPGPPVYQLADYLDQYGRRTRTEHVPDTGFWEAAAVHAHPDDQNALAFAAWARGLYRDAAQLWKNATEHGHPHGAYYLVIELRKLFPHDLRIPTWSATHMAADDPLMVRALLEALRDIGADDQVRALAERAAAHTALDYPGAVAWLLRVLQEVDADDQVRALVARAAAHTALDDPRAVAWLLRVLQEVDADDQVRALVARAAAHTALHDTDAVVQLLARLRDIGADDQVRALAARAAAHTALHDTDAVARLLGMLRRIGADDQVQALAARAATHTALDHRDAVDQLLRELQEVGADDQVRALVARAAAHTALHDTDAVVQLLGMLRRIGADDQVQALAARAVVHIALDSPRGVARLLQELRRIGADDQVQALAARAVDHTALDDLIEVTQLLDMLWHVGAENQIQALLIRDPAAHVALDGPPGAVAWLLQVLQEVGADDQVQALATRAAAHIALDHPDAVARLLQELRDTGADDQVQALLIRDPAAHAALDNPSEVAHLLQELREADAHDQVRALATRAAAHIAPDNSDTVARLLQVLREVGADDQVQALATRAAAHIALDHPDAVARLLQELRDTGADDQVQALLVRDPAAHAVLHDSREVAFLLETLLAIGADNQAKALSDRLPANGMFDLYLQSSPGRAERFRLGREPDGTAAQRWSWDDLE